MNIDDIKDRWDKENYDIQWLSSDAKSCISHHYACNCREYQRQEDIGELLRTVERLECALEKIANYDFRDSKTIKNLNGVEAPKIGAWNVAIHFRLLARQALKKEA